MSASNLLVLGLLLLTANLSLCALFAPSRVGGGAAERLVQLWKLLLLAMVEVGAWAIVLHEGGAAPTLLETFVRCASCFVLAGGEDGGFAAPWGEMKTFIALNGLLFVPVALVPWLTGSRASQTGPTFEQEPLEIPPVYTPPPIPDPAPAAFDSPPPEPPPKPATPPLAIRPAPERLPNAEPVPTARPAQSGPEDLSAEATPAVLPPPAPTATPSPTVPEAAPAPEQKPFGFRPTIPKVQPRLEPNSPEAELADLMKPVGPTPPPIRFRWHEETR
jgi:hypothetical protein